MVCIYCQSETRVVNSRPQKRVNKIWRRRTCTVCGITFTSLEAVDLAGSVRVRSQTTLEPFQRDKLLLTVHDSIKHRQTAYSDATGLTDTVIGKLLPAMTDGIVDRTVIVTVTIEVLKRFDRVAATHYQAFHPK